MSSSDKSTPKYAAREAAFFPFFFSSALAWPRCETRATACSCGDGDPALELPPRSPETAAFSPLRLDSRQVATACARAPAPSQVPHGAPQGRPMAGAGRVGALSLTLSPRSTNPAPVNPTPINYAAAVQGNRHQPTPQRANAPYQGECVLPLLSRRWLTPRVAQEAPLRRAPRLRRRSSRMCRPPSPLRSSLTRALAASSRPPVPRPLAAARLLLCPLQCASRSMLPRPPPRLPFNPRRK